MDLPWLCFLTSELSLHFVFAVVSELDRVDFFIFSSISLLMAT